jgi:hydroxymethylpyrimidine/phosphomethylpyrimidine kinase
MFHSLLAAKSSTYEEIGDATKTILNILHEVGNHKAFCAKFGITAEDLERTPESAATTAYGAYIIDTGLQGNHSFLFLTAR